MILAIKFEVYLNSLNETGKINELTFIKESQAPALFLIFRIEFN